MFDTMGEIFNRKYKEELELEKRVGRQTGMKVPEGYFKDFESRMMKELPPYPEAPAERKRTMWQKMVPYLSLAAMFMGIWLMMQVFHNVAQTDRINLDNPPEQIAMIMESPVSENLYIAPEVSFDDLELEQEISQEYNNMEEFEKAFEAAGKENLSSKAPKGNAKTPTT